MRRAALRPFARPGLLAATLAVAVMSGLLPWALGAALAGGLAVVGHEQPVDGA